MILFDFLAIDAESQIESFPSRDIPRYATGGVLRGPAASSCGSVGPRLITGTQEGPALRVGNDMEDLIEIAATRPATRIDYTRLDADVEEWEREHIQNIREAFGDEHVAEVLADLAANPWLALQWFLEDCASEVAALSAAA